AGPEGGHGGRRRLGHLVVPGPGHQEPGGDGAALPGVGRGGEGGQRGGRVEVGVVEDDEGRLAAQLEEHARQVLGGGGHDLASGGGGAGERDQVDARVGREHGAQGVVRAGDDVEDAGREVGLLGGDAG